MNNNDNNLQIPLKGVLKNPDDNIVNHKAIKKNLMKVCIVLLGIIIIIPIVVCLLIL
jgi:hypothetical protein